MRRGFLTIDSTVYHLGASLKELGKSLFAFSKLDVQAGKIYPTTGMAGIHALTCAIPIPKAIYSLSIRI